MSSISRRSAGVLLVFALAAVSAVAKPNFTGDWKMNASKSDFGQFPAPTSLTQKIAHDDPKLKVASKQSSERGDFEMEFNYTTDGKECTNTIRDDPVKSVLKWEGDTLIIESKSKFGDNDVTILDKWTLSEDGKVLTVNRHFASAMGEMDTKVVMEKQ